MILMVITPSLLGVVKGVAGKKKDKGKGKGKGADLKKAVGSVTGALLGAAGSPGKGTLKGLVGELVKATRGRKGKVGRVRKGTAKNPLSLVKRKRRSAKRA